MTTQRSSKLLPVLALALVLTTAVDARAQWGFVSNSGYTSVSPFGHEYVTGSGWGNTPYDYGSFGWSSSGGYGANSYESNSSGGVSSGGFGGIDAFPDGSNNPGNSPALTSHESFSDFVIPAPDTIRSQRRIQRRSQAQRNIRRTAVRR